MILAFKFWIGFWAVVFMTIALIGWVTQKVSELHSMKATYLPKHKPA